MATIIFDFDSTLVSIETLDTLILANIQDPAIQAAVSAITHQGMCGDISFAESLTRRLAMATITKNQVQAFAQQVCDYLTPGIEVLCHRLKQTGWDIWIMSGGLKEIILPCAKRLGISPNNVGAVEVRWGDQGACLGLDSSHPFNVSKVAGAASRGLCFPESSVAVGDGITDYALFEQGVVTHFIAYSEHKQHAPVLRLAPCVAKNVHQLTKQLNALV